MNEKKMELTKLDIITTNLVYEDGFNKITLELYVHDLLRILKIFKNNDNKYYSELFEKFINNVANSRNIKVDFDRKLFRCNLKEKSKWELREMLCPEQ